MGLRLLWYTALYCLVAVGWALARSITCHDSSMPAYEVFYSIVYSLIISGYDVLLRLISHCLEELYVTQRSLCLTVWQSTTLSYSSSCTVAGPLFTTGLAHKHCSYSSVVLTKGCGNSLTKGCGNSLTKGCGNSSNEALV